MKIFSQLNETSREHAIHYAQHQVIDNFIANGVEADPQTDEDKAEFQKIIDAFKHVETIEDYADKIEYLFEHDAVWDLSFEIALDMAQSAYFHEPGETVFYLSDIDECFGDDEETPVEEVKKEDEVLADVIPFPSKKSTKVLN